MHEKPNFFCFLKIMINFAVRNIWKIKYFVIFRKKSSLIAIKGI